jgi:hypothetical protein
MAVLMLALLLGLTSVAESLDVKVAPYQESRRAGALGVVTGRVAAEPRTMQAPARPFTGTTVMLLPRSEALLARLERLRQGARESAAAFTAAAPAMRKARETYERELWEAGAPDLTPTVTVDADGSFKIEDVPAGAWMLLAWHGTPVNVGSPTTTTKPKTQKKDLYLPQSRLQGYQDVTVWLREVTVTGGETTRLELTDRNGWFRGVAEERMPGGGREAVDRISGRQVGSGDVLAGLADLRLRVDGERPLGVLASLGLAGNDQAVRRGRLHGAARVVSGSLLHLGRLLGLLLLLGRGRRGGGLPLSQRTTDGARDERHADDQSQDSLHCQKSSVSVRRLEHRDPR